jgi:hypothetical protein
MSGNSPNPDASSLPYGVQTFAKLRGEDMIYVDKTRFLLDLIRLRGTVFCARPRRFGKSLTVSTLEAFFSGRKDLFRGLAAEEYLNSPDFRPRPVIHLDMSAVAGSPGREILDAKIRNLLKSESKKHGVPFEGVDASDAFRSLLENITLTVGEKAVLLIDEYDAPVLAIAQKAKPFRDEQLLDQTRDVMRSFYSQIKASEKYIDFTFITGVSKFSRMGVFSSLNNINDISLSPDYAAFMGYTHEELEENFSPFIERVAEKFGVTQEEMLEQIRAHYNGFSFDGETLLYNPFSTLGFFSTMQFGNYWMESGSGSFIREFLKDKKLTVDQFRGMPVDEDFARVPGEIEKTSPEGFLYQAGYLTLRKRGEDDYRLDYPNFEVLSAISAFFLKNILTEADENPYYTSKVRSCLNRRDVPSLVEEFDRMFASVSFLDYYQAVKNKLGENFYRAMIQVFLNGAGVMTRSEEHNNMGRADIVAAWGKNTLVIEMKAAADEASAARMAGEGMEQMKARGYGNRYAEPILLSLAIDSKKRGIGAWLSEDTRLSTREDRTEALEDGESDDLRPSW